MTKVRNISTRPALSAVAALALLVSACAPAMQKVATETPVTAQPEDTYLTLDGARIRVRIEGPQKAPPIILIHGFSFSLESWDACAKRHDLNLIGSPPARFGALGQLTVASHF